MATVSVAGDILPGCGRVLRPVADYQLEPAALVTDRAIRTFSGSNPAPRQHAA